MVVIHTSTAPPNQRFGCVDDSNVGAKTQVNCAMKTCPIIVASLIFPPTPFSTETFPKEPVFNGGNWDGDRDLTIYISRVASTESH